MDGPKNEFEELTPEMQEETAKLFEHIDVTRSRPTESKTRYTEEDVRNSFENAHRLYRVKLAQWKKSERGPKPTFSMRFVNKRSPFVRDWLRARPDRDQFEFISEEAKKDWFYQKQTRWNDKKIREALRELFSKWKKRNIKQGGSFNFTYVAANNQALYSWLLRHNKRIEDFLSEEAVEKWQGQEAARPRKEGEIVSDLDKLYEEWKKGSQEEAFSPAYIIKYAPDIYSWVLRHQAEGGKELVDYLGDEARSQWTNVRGVSQMARKAERLFAEDNADIQTIKRLSSLFGASRIVDTFYAYRPDFRKVPPERLRKVIAPYLGNFLITRPPFRIDNLEMALPYLENEELAEGLYEVIKDGALLHFLTARKRDKNTIPESSFADYFLEIEKGPACAKSPGLRLIINRVRGYYQDVTKDRPRPEALVGSLKEGRDFPDIYQAINMKELEEKKRLLIADEMGVGKSGSVILTKEYLGAQTALVVVPSNVEETWINYLSSKVEDGEQVGYFKPDSAPRVLRISSPSDIENLTPGMYDYIVVSHERLAKGNYVEALLRAEPGMLIADEVHKFKNATTGRRAAGFIELADAIQGDNKYVALLSGTPAPNKVEDIATTLRVLYPERFSMVENRHLARSILNGSLIDLRALLATRMQRKSLADHIEMPALQEELVRVDLNGREQEIYELLLEEDEFTPAEKIRILRQFCMNHELLDVTPGVEQAKLVALKAELHKAFAEHDKVVLFVNAYIENVIRGDLSILDLLDLPESVQVRAVHGDNKKERQAVQQQLNKGAGKMLVAVSGQIADVGVDYSGAEHIIFYNEPWTEAERRQLIGRVYRPGLRRDLNVQTLITHGTIEHGIHHYLQVKQRAIEKLIEGIPITELEQQVLAAPGHEDTQNLEVNRDLAEAYFSAFERLNAMYAHTKEIGQKDFQKFLEQYGKLYADCYLNVGGRSYQGNASRIAGTIIETMRVERGEDPKELKILDAASGPQMLKTHSPEDLQGSIHSTDINLHHFKEGDMATVGSFTSLPYREGSFDYATLSLALHYSRFIPKKGNYERAQIFMELNRALKPGGRAIISLMYRLDLKNFEGFRGIMRDFGFRVVDEYTDHVQEGNTFRAHVITIEKIESPAGTVEEIVATGPSRFVAGLKFNQQKGNLRNSRKTVLGFKLAERDYQVKFNKEDLAMMREEEETLREGKRLKHRYGGIELIPVGILRRQEFVRMLLNDRYILFKRLTHGGGGVKIDNNF
ncbi:MAG: hypothetical protein COV10_02680 [Candidatus Vogelbacteria bacterium CG10_big_fil_rev_8_21_14_0_10_51_16]|uniref:Helicase n=1 Tax=Candidatus Vogelbacteria bacterium CG10_big_fil_rev_8_21_14_0_10_51_16 TaxID=1975045 RepID=A0A2H0RG41_9BACT|nr:MAG: hypothetical protein COV10_02680 [Candidatus Vogelbacteria bacterium CG10_big_fil_rev_8_21_14_0_10_51_16]